ncbi:MAG: Lrp/AsnC family transcriptional regulator [Candidatus Nanohaloarchaea archaeon]
MSLDDRDIQIIERLEEDGRASLREIASDLDLSPSTVSNRFHRLKKEGVVKGFRPVLDHEKIGFKLTAVVDVRVEAGMKEKVFPELAGMDGVISEYVVTGDTDMVLICKFPGREEMYSFLKQLQKKDGISETETKVALDSPEENGRLDLSRPED